MSHTTPPTRHADRDAWTPERVRRLRERLQLTQQEFARRLGLESRGAVSRFERADPPGPPDAPDRRRHRTPTGPTAVLLGWLEWMADRPGGMETISEFFS